MTATEIDLTPFCNSETRRYDLAKPFVQRGYRYATDGWRIVRVPCKEPDSKGDYPRDLAEMFSKWPRKFVALPETLEILSEVDECPDCKGNGKRNGGKCRPCDGDGRREQPSHAKLLGIYLAPAAIESIRALPGPITCALIRGKYCGGRAIFFRFNGGEAIVAQKVRT